MPTATAQPYGINLPIRRGSSGYFNQTYDVLEQIRLNLTTLLRTRRGERRMNPSFGTDLYSSLFEFDSEELSAVLTNVVRRDVEKWMPYVNIEDVKADTSESVRDTNVAKMTVLFTVKALGVTSPQSIDIAINQPLT